MNIHYKHSSLLPTAVALLCMACQWVAGIEKLEPPVFDECMSDSDCDDGEACNGSETCLPVGLCREGQAIPDGRSCTTQAGDPNGVCRGGICVPGYCDTNTDCFDGYLCTDDVCDEENHMCVNEASSTDRLCRESEGDCDVAEYCDGSSPACPEDAFLAAGDVCRLSDGACDVEETCDGESPACPVDGVQPSTAVCRPEAGACDVPERCDGEGTDCPEDGYLSATELCRDAAGDCDRAELCPGDSAYCPVDTFLSDATPCREALTPCDAVEYCTGLSADCPEDGFLPTGDPCDDGNPCTYPNTCTDTHSCGVEVSVMHDVSQVSVGGVHTCALMKSGGLKCWGRNAWGQLGDGSVLQRNIPGDVVGLAFGVRSVSAGEGHTCAVLDTGGIQCWGYNQFGALGTGTVAQSLVPVDVIDLPTNASAVDSGMLHTCAILDDGSIMCWGYNGGGQLGDDSTANRLSPVAVAGSISNAGKISAGAFHTCAVLDTGDVKCWGNNAQGQLGTGTTTDSRTPVDVTGLSGGVTSVATGYEHTCVVDSGGALCWGGNDFGQIGNGTTSASTTPSPVSGLSANVMAVATGSYHSCALLATGEIHCWGANFWGQLGNGTTVNSSTPQAVAGLPSSAIALDANGTDDDSHSCALLDDESVACWGSGTWGQLGAGSTTNSSTPCSAICPP